MFLLLQTTISHATINNNNLTRLIQRQQPSWTRFRTKKSSILPPGPPLPSKARAGFERLVKSPAHPPAKRQAGVAETNKGTKNMHISTMRSDIFFFFLIVELFVNGKQTKTHMFSLNTFLTPFLYSWCNNHWQVLRLLPKPSKESPPKWTSGVEVS